MDDLNTITGIEQPAETPADTEADAEVDHGFDETAEALGIERPADEPEEAEGEEWEPEEPERISLKVNGKTVEKTLDEIKALAQQQIAGEAKLEKAKAEIEDARKTKQQAETQINAVREMLQILQKGDLATIAEFARNHLNAGDVFDKAVIQYALQLYEYSKLSPEQREAHENKKLVEKYRMEMQERQRQDQERAMQLRVNQYSEMIANEVPKAIKQVGLTDSDFVREQIISTWRVALENGQNPTPLAVANFVKQRLEEAKMLHTPSRPPSMPARPKATRESVGMKRKQESDSAYYSSWDDWVKNRAR